MGWVVALLLYAIGALEVYMSRRNVDGYSQGIKIFGTIIWPIIVVIAYAQGPHRDVC